MLKLKLFTIFAILLFTSLELSSQSFQVYQIQTDEFPKVKADFKAKNNFMRDYDNLTKADFRVTENGNDISNKVELVCEEYTQKQPLSVAMIVDASGSMVDRIGGETLFELTQYASKAFVDSLDFVEGTAISFIQFSNFLAPRQEGWLFTKQRAEEEIGWIRNPLAGATNFNTPFLDQINGAFVQFQRRPEDIRRVAIFLTDGVHEIQTPFAYDNIINRAKQLQVQIYVVMIGGSPITTGLDWIATETGGKLLRANSKIQLSDVYTQIAQEIQDVKGCWLEWQSDFECDEKDLEKSVDITFTRPNPNITVNRTYNPGEAGLAGLVINESQLLFGSTDIGITSQNLTLTANGSNLVLNGFSITPNDGSFQINWNGSTPADAGGLRLNKGQSREITITYLQPSAAVSRKYNFQLNTDICPANPVELVAPCGGKTHNFNFERVALSSNKILSIESFENTTATSIQGNVEIVGTDANEFEILSINGVAGTDFNLEFGEKINVEVRFSPTSLGVKNAQLKYNFNEVCGEYRSNLVAEAFQSAIDLPVLDFELVRVKTLETKIYSLDNKSGANLVITEMNLSSTDFNIEDLSAQLPISIPNNSNFDFEVTFNPQTVGIKNAQIELTINGIDETQFVSINGIGFLPEFEAEDLDFGGVNIGNSYEMDLTIRNTANFGVLSLSNFQFEFINSLPGEFEFVNIVNNVNIPAGGEVVMPVRFSPQQAGIRTATIIVKGDNVEGPNPISLADNTIILTGLGNSLLEPFDVADFNFGSISNCETGEYVVNLDNLDNPNNVNVEIEFEAVAGSDFSAFSVVNNTFLIDANSNSILTIFFNPSEVKEYRANVKLTTDRGVSEFEVVGRGLVYQVPVIAEGGFLSLEAGKFEMLELIVDVPSTSNIVLDFASIDIRFDRSKIAMRDNPLNPELAYITDANGNRINGWNVTVNRNLEMQGRITISAQGNAIPTPSKLKFYVSMMPFVSETNVSNIIATAGFKNEVTCLDPIASNIEIRLEGCVTDMRSISMSRNIFSLQFPAPHPITKDTELVYSVGLNNVSTKIQLLNSVGNIVHTFVDEVMNQGIYSIFLSIGDFPNGAYFLRMNSGPYTETHKIIISK